MVSYYFLIYVHIILKTDVIFANFKSYLLFSDDLLKYQQIASAKKLSFVLIILIGISFSWMVFETSSAFTSARTSSLEINSKGKLVLSSYYDATARMLGWMVSPFNYSF